MESCANDIETPLLKTKPAGLQLLFPEATASLKRRIAESPEPMRKRSVAGAVTIFQRRTPLRDEVCHNSVCACSYGNDSGNGVGPRHKYAKQ